MPGDLVREGIAVERVRFVGNVMIDSLLHNREFARAPATTVAAGGFDPALIGGPEGYGVVTLHRPSNVDHPDVLASLLGVLSEITRQLPLVFALHPRTKANIERFAWPAFHTNPYSATNGGPCQVPADIFTNPEARRLFRQRLRHTLARWGYSPRLSMLELWAEADVTEGFDSHVEAARDWHQEMADFIHATDPYQHPVTSSLSHRSKSAVFDSSGIFAIGSIDVVATELYNDRDMGEAVHDDALHTMNKYRKPQLCIELGLAHGMFSDDRDVNGIHMHAVLWSSVTSGSSTTPCFWHWSKIMELQLLPHFSAIAKYLDDENFIGLHPLKVEAALQLTAARAGVWRPRTAHSR